MRHVPNAMSAIGLSGIIVAGQSHDHEELYVLSRYKSFTTPQIFQKTALPGHVRE
jgi:hypothetical protein